MKSHREEVRRVAARSVSAAPRPSLLLFPGDGYIGAGSTPTKVFLEDIKQLAPDFPKAKRLYLALGENLARLREWFGAFYHKPEMADEVAVWGSPQQIADEIRRLKAAGLDFVLLHPVFDEEEQMERLAKEVLPMV